MARIDLSASGAGALPVLLDAVRSGRDVLAIGPGAAAVALVHEAAAALEATCRTVAVSAGPGPLSLSGLMAQLSGTGDLAGQDDAVVETGYRRLAVPDAPGGRIALLVADAALLQRAALRFLQHVSRNAPALTLVLAGGDALEAALNEPDFAALRARLPAAAPVPVPVPAPVPAPVAALREPMSTMSVRRRRLPLWAGLGAGLAASVTLAAWALRPAPPASVGQVAAVVTPVQAEPVPQKRPEPARAEANTAAISVPPLSVPPLSIQPAPAPPPTATSTATAAVERALPALRPAPKQAEARSREAPARPATRQARVNRAAPRLPEFDRPGPADSEPRRDPYYAEGRAERRVAPPWARRSYEPWSGPPSDDGPYIGTFAAGADGMRTFRYEGGPDYGGWR